MFQFMPQNVEGPEQIRIYVAPLRLGMLFVKQVTIDEIIPGW